VAQAVVCLLCKGETLSSTPVPPRNKEKSIICFGIITGKYYTYTGVQTLLKREKFDIT
jgi:hypothetical protein